MARVTVEDCLDNVDNRFELVMLATRRARSLANTAAEPLVERENDKVTVLALREISEGRITREILDQMEAEEAAQERLEEVQQAASQEDPGLE